MLENLLQEAAQAKSAGDNQQAALIYEQAIKICEEDQSQSDYLAFCLQELAAIYIEQGLYDQGIPIYKKLIGLGSKILGENHPDVINTAVCLARALEANKQFAQADEIFKLAASRAERALGLSHPLAQEIRQEYFDLLSNREAGDQDESLKLGLVPLPAAKRTTSRPSVAPNTPDTNSPAKTKAPVPVKKLASQPKKIKNLRYGAQSAQEKAGNLLNIQVLRHRWRGILYIASVILGIAAITVSLSTLLLPVHISAANLIGEQLIVKSLFQSVDGNRGVQFIDNRFAILATDVQHRKIPYFLLQGSLSDIWAVLLSTVVTKESWYQFAGDELISEDGSIFYSSGSPEFLVANKMRFFADVVKRYYNSHSCYPDKIEKLAGSGLTYINPFSGKAEMPLIKRANGSFGRDNIFPGVQPEATIIDCYNFLRAGGSWHEDFFPGKISSLALYTSARCPDGFNKVNEFYIHGYDRHSKLLTSGKPQTAYVIGFLGGKNLSNENSERMEEIERTSVHAPRRMYIVPGSSTDLQFVHQLGGNLLTGLVILSGVGWVFFGLRRRIEQPDTSIKAIDIIFALSLILWLISFIIHLYG